MEKNLAESLSSTRSKTKGQIVEIESVDSYKAKVPYLVLGFMGCLYGIAIYYVLPTAVISLNLGLMLSIFFSILLGMILGLTLIAFNLQRIVELVFI